MKKVGIAIVATLALNVALSFFLFNNFEQSIRQDVETALSEAKPAVHFTGQKNDHLNSKPATNNFVPEDFVETAEMVTSAVVNITVKSRSSYEAISGGSGVIVSRDGYIITNNHVIDGGGKIEVTLHNNRSYAARIIGKDPTTDLALVKISENDLPTLRYANSDRVEVGEWVLAVGNPFNLTSTVTAGIVSAKGRNINILRGLYSIESFIQTDAVVNPGNSGGALVNMEGELVGINSAIMSESGGYEGYSFAIPSNLVRKIMSDLREFGKVQRGVLGISIKDVNEEIAADFDLDEVEGVFISKVNEGSSADEAGIQMNDIIVAVNGNETKTVPELQEQVARFRPGDVISLELIRYGKKIEKNDIVLQAIKDDSDFNR